MARPLGIHHIFQASQVKNRDSPLPIAKMLSSDRMFSQLPTKIIPVCIKRKQSHTQSCTSQLFQVLDVLTTLVKSERNGPLDRFLGAVSFSLGRNKRIVSTPRNQDSHIYLDNINSNSKTNSNSNILDNVGN